MFYWFAYHILRLFSKIFFPYSVYGLENVPAQGVFILASNHLSNIDPIVIGTSVTCKISYMAKESLFQNKILGFLLTRGNAFPIKRDASDVRSLRTAMKRLKAGNPLLLFPEGTRKGYVNSREVRSGVGFLVKKSAVPVIPVRVVDSDMVLPPRAKWFRRHPIAVIFGKPIWFPANSDYAQISLQIMEEIHSLQLPR